jgi:hypothetical protein
MTMIEHLKEQVAEEIGEDELNKEQKKMVLMKYGIIYPQLTAAERHIIIKENRKHGTTSQ